MFVVRRSLGLHSPFDVGRSMFDVTPVFIHHSMLDVRCSMFIPYRLPHMPINHPSNDFQQGQRKVFEQTVRGDYTGFLVTKALLAHIVAVVSDRFFAGAPAAFESQQAVVVHIGAPQVEQSEALLHTCFNGPPHGQIVGSQMQEPFVGGTVFKYGVIFVG